MANILGNCKRWRLCVIISVSELKPKENPLDFPHCLGAQEGEHWPKEFNGGFEELGLEDAQSELGKVAFQCLVQLEIHATRGSPFIILPGGSETRG